jgi:hypothetical protein
MHLSHCLLCGTQSLSTGQRGRIRPTELLSHTDRRRWSVEVLCCWHILPAAGVRVVYSWFLQQSSLAWRWDDGRWAGRWSMFCFWKFNQHQSRKKRWKKGRTELCDVCWYSVSINYFLFQRNIAFSLSGIWP